MTADQFEVVDWYQSHAEEAATVGDYVRVITGQSKKSCFGPTKEYERLGWEVVEIDWINDAFLLAPKGGEE